ncbi:MAG: hypothetical protein QNJ54_18195 [Prochloraceae cyanobacterium]|nr:hypothetical protein [Prochloraceae cyanobacterium]
MIEEEIDASTLSRNLVGGIDESISHTFTPVNITKHQYIYRSSFYLDHN